MFSNKSHADVQSVAVNLDASLQPQKSFATKETRGSLPNKKDTTMENLYSSLLGQKRKSYFMTISRLYMDFKHVLNNQQCKKGFYLLSVLALSSMFSIPICIESKSTALMTYMYISLLDLSVICTFLLSLWVEQQRSNATFTFGYGRFEVLAVFSCNVATLLGAIFIFKDCLVNLLYSDQQIIIDGSKMIFGVLLIMLTRLILITFTESKAWNHVIVSSRSNILQTRLTKLSDNLCQIVPGLSRFLLPRVNPFVLLTYIGAASILLAHLIIDFKGFQTADTIVTLWLAVSVWITMYPMFKYTGLILLQAVPSHITDQLDKCLRETATLDGILEFRNEHFWTASFGVVAGSLHVRVRRDANEQLILSQVTNRLSSFASVLTVQVFKDDWTRATTIHLLNQTSRITSYPSLQPPFAGPTSTPSYKPNIFQTDFLNGSTNPSGSSIVLAPSPLSTSASYSPIGQPKIQDNYYQHH